MFGIDSRRDPAVEGGPRPVAEAFCVPVFHRVVMDVIEVPLKIVLVFEGVFPISRLPDAAPPLTLPGVAEPRGNASFKARLLRSLK